MSDQQPQERASRARPSSHNMWNPCKSLAHQALGNRPDLAAQYLEGIKEEKEEEGDGNVQGHARSDSQATIDTITKRLNARPPLPSQIEGDPLYVPEGRRLANNGNLVRPYAEVETMLTTLSFVLTAVQVACAAGGKAFTVPPRNTRANNSFWYPLQCMKSDLKNLYRALDAWSRPMMQMGVEDRALKRFNRTNTAPLTDKERFSMVYKALRRVGDIDDSYLYPYVGVPSQLEPVNVELQNIMFLLTSIIEEGNGPADQKVETDKDATENKTDVESAASTTEHDLDLDDLVLDDPLAPAPEPHNPHAPTWKQSVPHIPQASLHVTPIDRQVFRRVLTLAEEVHGALVSVVGLCETLHEKGLATQKVWQTWMGFAEKLQEKRRAKKNPPKPTGYDMGN